MVISLSGGVYNEKASQGKGNPAQEVEEPGADRIIDKKGFRASRLTSREGRGFDSLIAHMKPQL